MGIEINFVYLPQSGIDKIYEDENGVIYRTKRNDPKQINIALGYIANRKPSGTDSVLCLEPRCVAPLDYGEDIRKFHKIFSWCKPGMDLITNQNVHIINHPSWNDPPQYESLIRPQWSERSGFVIVSNNKTSDHYSQIYDIRVSIADYLHSQGADVSWYGQDPIDRPYYKGSVQDKMEVLRKARFCICPENCYDEVYSHGYFSEKMPDAWFGGCVPLYMGCYNIDDFNIPKESYIDLRKFVTKTQESTNVMHSQIQDVVNNYTESDYTRMIQSTNDFMNREDGLYYLISSKRAYKEIIKSFL